MPNRKFGTQRGGCVVGRVLSLAHLRTLPRCVLESASVIGPTVWPVMSTYQPPPTKVPTNY